ncbi:MAG: CoA transferase [Chloroflexi bacterium]|nr:CoA transferase [Chloroflexota bacterium]
MLMPAALDDIKVLDISQGIAGPFCAKLLADFGADVIKVEPPGGEVGRSMGPFFHDDPHPEKSLFFLLLNLNKRGITLDLATRTGATIFKELAKKADVVVETFQPEHLTSLGLEYDSLANVNPGIVLTSITTFGQTGPYSRFKGEEIVAYAMSSIMSVSGTSDREPLKHGGFQAQYEGGLNGALATAFALLTREWTGEGQHVDVSIQEVVSSSLVSNQPYYSWTGGVQGRRRRAGTMFGNIMPCKDGYFISQAGGGATWDEIAEFYGREELKELRFANADQRLNHGEEMDAILIDAVKDRTMDELFKTASEKYRMLFGIAQTPADLADCPQLESRGFYQEVDHPVIGKIRVPNLLFNMSETPSRYRIPAPLLGQHNEEVYTQVLSYSMDDLAKLRQLGVV